MKDKRGSEGPILFESDRLTDLDREANAKLFTVHRTQPIAFYVAGIVVAVGAFLIFPFARSFELFLFVFACVFGPLVLSMIPMWFWRNTVSQLILTFAAIVYAVWFLLIYSMVRNARDAMAVLMFFYVGLVASPFLFVIGVFALPFHLWRNQD